jgi:hypothetical protein
MGTMADNRPGRTAWLPGIVPLPVDRATAPVQSCISSGAGPVQSRVRCEFWCGCSLSPRDESKTIVDSAVITVL